MYLAELRISNFRRLRDVTVSFEPSLNIILGPNNIGKTAVVDALRALLAGADDPYPRFTQSDLHVANGISASAIRFDFTFRDLSLDDEADFLHALSPSSNGNIEAKLGVAYGDADKAGRLRSRRWCGLYEDVSVTSSMLENLRSVYLQPLRDAEQGLRPSRNSQLARLLQLLSDEPGRQTIAAALSTLDDELKKQKPIADTQTAISGRHNSMLGEQLAQSLQVGLSANDFQKLAARVSILVNQFEIEQNGLGYNNLIYMAVVLSELAKSADSAFRGLIVEEPEAHLHPQLQAVLLRYLSKVETGPGEKPVQVFVTSHSPNFASIADLDTISCLVETSDGVEAFSPRSIAFGKGKKEKLRRYLDVTRAELFFARRIIFVEGAAELLLINILAQREGYDLRSYGVSLISVEGLNFDSFMPLFGEKAIKIPVSVVTDADPHDVLDENGNMVPQYPAATDTVVVSANTSAMKKLEDKLVRVFCGVKTFEYDLALFEQNRIAMLAALKDIHPNIGSDLEVALAAEGDDRAKARLLFQGMFERPTNNVQKGKFAQALAARIADDDLKVVAPAYLIEAVTHACQK